MKLNETRHLLMQGFFKVGTQRKDQSWSVLAMRLIWGSEILERPLEPTECLSQSMGIQYEKIMGYHQQYRIGCVCKVENAEWRIESDHGLKPHGPKLALLLWHHLLLQFSVPNISAPHPSSPGDVEAKNGILDPHRLPRIGPRPIAAARCHWGGGSQLLLSLLPLEKYPLVN